MLIMAAMLAIAAPGAPDVQALEETHVLAPLIDHTRDGRSYVEFAPTVETRAATCTPLTRKRFDCRYEARKRDAFDAAFGPWEARRVRMVRRGGCWRVDQRASIGS